MTPQTRISAVLAVSLCAQLACGGDRVRGTSSANAPAAPKDATGGPGSGLLAAAPSALAFGSVNVGSTSSQTVTVTNDGTASATVTQVNVAGAGFGASGYSLPATLAPGQGGAITVSFAPAAAGAATGQISVVSDAAGSPLVIPVTGTGVQASSPPPPAPPPPAPPPPAGQLFYVATTGSDANPGTSTAPWRTIGHAARTLAAGQTALVADGTYEEGQIDFASSGASGSPITIRSQNPWGATLATVAGCNPAFSVSQSWIAIEDLVITASPNDVACASPSSAAGAVRCWGSNTPTAASPSTGWVGCTLRGIRVDRNPVFDVGVKTNQDYSLFENNVIYGSMEAFNNYGTVFRNNIVYDGDAWGSMVYGKGGVRSLQIHDNVVHMTRSYAQGLFLGGSSGGWWWDPATHYEAYDSVAYNNVVVNEVGGSLDALGMYGAQRCALFDNVVIGGHLFFDPGSAAGLSPQPWPDSPSIQNNIVECGVAQAVVNWTYTGTMTLDYNDFYGCLSAPPQVHLAVGVDPLFVNPLSDWHLLAASPLVGAGTTLGFTGFAGEPIDVSMNHDGAARTVPWSPGIY